MAAKRAAYAASRLLGERQDWAVHFAKCGLPSADVAPHPRSGQSPEAPMLHQGKMAAYAIALLVGYSPSWWSFVASNSLGRALHGSLFYAFVRLLESLAEKVHDCADSLVVSHFGMASDPKIKAWQFDVL